MLFAQSNFELRSMTLGVLPKLKLKTNYCFLGIIKLARYLIKLNDDD